LSWQAHFGKKKAKIALNYIITTVLGKVYSQFLFREYVIGNIQFTFAVFFTGLNSVAMTTKF